jgi:hypothetical protein
MLIYSIDYPQFAFLHLTPPTNVEYETEIEKYVSPAT